MNYRTLPPIPAHATILLVAAILCLCHAAPDLLAQESLESSWQATAEARLKTIYDRGEFRAKAYRPTWLNDTGFVVEEADLATGKPAEWFHDAMTGEGLAWKSDGKLLVPRDSGRSLHGTLQLEARRDQLVAIDQSNQQETALISGPEGRVVEYRNPVWSPDGGRVVFIEADYTDVKQRSIIEELRRPKVLPGGERFSVAWGLSPPKSRRQA